MLEHKKIRSLDDYFVDLNGRQSREVYFTGSMDTRKKSGTL